MSLSVTCACMARRSKRTVGEGKVVAKGELMFVSAANFRRNQRIDASQRRAQYV